MKPVVTAYQFQNGQVMAFDVDGKQVPEYQGHASEVVPKLMKDFPELDIEKRVWPHT